MRQGSTPRALRRALPWTLALAATLGLAACGGGGNPSPPSLATVASVNAASTAPSSAPSGGFQQLVVFGDSLSDGGTYTPAAVLATQGSAAVASFGTALVADPANALTTYGAAGGKFTVNPGPIWVGDLATALGVPTPLPNEIGYGSVEISTGVFSPTIFPTMTCQSIQQLNSTVDPSLCTDYAQGGSRVALQPGIGHYTINTTTGLPYTDGSGQPYVSALTVPMTDQVTNYLTEFHSFNANQLVAVLGGNNDIFFALSNVQTQVTAAVTQAVTAAVTANPSLTTAQIDAIKASTTETATAAAVTAAQTAVAQAADALSGLVQTVLDNGGKYVVVYTLPDSSLTPFGQSLSGGTTCNVQDPSTPCYLLSNLVNVFNQQLLNDLQGKAVKVLDGHALLAQEIANPAQFGLSNVTTPWCSPLTGGSSTSAPNSLMCSAATPNTAAGATTADLGSWLFADGVHPTPAGYAVIAGATHADLISFGWAQ